MSKSVLSVTVNDLEQEFKHQAKPFVYVANAPYIGYDPKTGDLRYYPRHEVVKIVYDVLGVHPVDTLDRKTTVMIVPDNWKLDHDAYDTTLLSQVNGMPFSALLHYNVKNRREYLKLIPPPDAIKQIRQDMLLRNAYKNDLLIALPPNSRERKHKRASTMEDKDSILSRTSEDRNPEDLRTFSFKGHSDTMSIERKPTPRRRPSSRRPSSRRPSTGSRRRKTSTRRPRRRSSSSSSSTSTRRSRRRWAKKQ